MSDQPCRNDDCGRNAGWPIHNGFCPTCFAQGEGDDPAPRQRHTRPDGSFDVLAYCRSLDASYAAAFDTAEARA